jgi:hypothetical protein
MGKIRCYKGYEYQICKTQGLMQVFYRKDGSISYARIRHFSHLDQINRKPQFIYHRQDDLGAIENFIKSQGISTSKSLETKGQGGHDCDLEQHDLDLKPLSSNLDKTGRSSSLVRTLALRAKGRRFKSGSAHH